MPSYKYKINSDEYDYKRTPSYTDRILFRAKEKEALSILNYDVDTMTRVSDHKPVMLFCEIRILKVRSS